MQGISILNKPGLLPFQSQSSSLHLHIPRIISQIHGQGVHDWPPEVRKLCYPRHCKGQHLQDGWKSIPRLHRLLATLPDEGWSDGILGDFAARIFWRLRLTLPRKELTILKKYYRQRNIFEASWLPNIVIVLKYTGKLKLTAGSVWETYTGIFRQKAC